MMNRRLFLLTSVIHAFNRLSFVVIVDIYDEERINVLKVILSKNRIFDTITLMYTFFLEATSLWV